MNGPLFAKVRGKQVLTTTTIVGAALLFFQNCSPGFKVLEQASMPFASLSVVMAPTATKGYVGDSATLSVVAYTIDDVKLTYQWKKSGNELVGQTAPDLMLQNLTSADAGTYTIEIKAESLDGKVQSKTIETQTVQLDVAPTPSADLAPSISSMKPSFAMKSGAQGFQRADVDGYPKPSLQWYKDGVAITDQNRNFLLFSSAKVSDGGLYVLEASNRAGVVRSDASMIAIDHETAAPLLVSLTSTQRLALGATLQLNASVVAIPMPAFQWYKDGVAIVGASSSSFTLPNAMTTNSGTYKVVASNSDGVIEGTVAVTVIDSIRVTTPLKDEVIAVGKNLSLQPVFGGSIDKYEWFKDDVLISGATTATFSLTNVAPSAAGRYKVRATNISGSVESTSNVTVIASPIVTTALIGQNVNELVPATFTVQTSGSALTYKWYRDAVLIVGANTNTLQILQTSYLDEGIYKVEISNIAGSVASQAALTVPLLTDGVQLYARECASCHSSIDTSARLNRTAAQIKTAMMTVPAMMARFEKNDVVRLTDGQLSAIAAALYVGPPTITTQPMSQSVFEKQNATFTVVANGKALTYQWLKNSAKIVGATSASVTLVNVSASDAASYTVTVTNIGGSVSSQAAVLTVNGPPTVETDLADINIYETDSFKFKVTGFTGSQVTYTWLRDDVVQTQGALTLANLPTIGLDNVKLSDASTYKLRVSNPAGTIEKIGKVTIKLDPIVITSRPTDTTVSYCGDPLNLKVVATGRKLSYEWSMSGSPGSITNSYHLDSGQCGSGELTIKIASGSQSLTYHISLIRSFLKVVNGVPTFVSGTNPQTAYPNVNLATLRPVVFNSFSGSQLFTDGATCYFLTSFRPQTLPCNGAKMRFLGDKTQPINTPSFSDDNGLFSWYDYPDHYSMASFVTSPNANYSKFRRVGDRYYADDSRGFYLRQDVFP